MSGSTGAGGSSARTSTSLDGHQHRSTEVRQNGASDLKVRKAAEEAAAYKQRFHPLERQLEDVKGEQRRQRWMLGVNLILLLGVFWRVFTKT